MLRQVWGQCSFPVRSQRWRCTSAHWWWAEWRKKREPCTEIAKILVFCQRWFGYKAKLKDHGGSSEQEPIPVRPITTGNYLVFISISELPHVPDTWCYAQVWCCSLRELCSVSFLSPSGAPQQPQPGRGKDSSHGGHSHVLGKPTITTLGFPEVRLWEQNGKCCPREAGKCCCSSGEREWSCKAKLWDCRWMSVAPHMGRCLGAMQHATVYFHFKCR